MNTKIDKALAYLEVKSATLRELLPSVVLISVDGSWPLKISEVEFDESDLELIFTDEAGSHLYNHCGAQRISLYLNGWDK